MNKKQDLIMIGITNFYLNNDENIRKLMSIIRGNSQLSLRIIDYFITNYTKKHNCSYVIKKNESPIPFFIYSSYKQHLKAPH